MAQPGVVQLKRKRNEEPLEYLVLQSEDHRPQGPRYVRQKKGEDAHKDTEIPNPLQNTNLPTSERRESTEKRIFELQRKPLTNTRKRKDATGAAEEDIATFVEKKQRRAHNLPAPQHTSQPPAQEEAPPSTPLKRPGKGSTLRTPTKPQQAETEAERKQMEALAAYMHSAALETLEPTPSLNPKAAPSAAAATRPAAVSAPKLSGARSQQIHRQRAATNGSISSNIGMGMGMVMDLDDEDGGYVYDTYILAPSTDAEALQFPDATTGGLDAGLDGLPLGSVGYLVINEDDRGLWEMYLEEDEGASEKDWDSEADDENAENYFGAEYPDEEEFSDSGEEGGFGGGFGGRRTGLGWANDEEYYGGFDGESEGEDMVVRGGVVPRRLRRFEMA